MAFSPSIAQFSSPPPERHFEPFARDPGTEGPCQHCHRLLDPVAIHFKGSGFHNTDYKNKERAGASKDGDSGSEGDGKSESKSDSGSSEKKSDSSNSDSVSKAKSSSSSD